MRIHNNIIDLHPSAENDDYTQHPEFQGHVVAVMTAIGQAVQLMSNVDALVPMLRRVGVAHSQFDVRPEYWTAFGQALLWTLQTALGKAWNVETRNGWSQMFSTIRTVMEPCMRQAPAAAHNGDAADAHRTPRALQAATPQASRQEAAATTPAPAAATTPASASRTPANNQMRALQLVRFPAFHSR